MKLHKICSYSRQKSVSLAKITDLGNRVINWTTAATIQRFDTGLLNRSAQNDSRWSSIGSEEKSTTATGYLVIQLSVPVNQLKTVSASWKLSQVLVNRHRSSRHNVVAEG